jgi:hypothetical protein
VYRASPDGAGPQAAREHDRGARIGDHELDPVAPRTGPHGDLRPERGAEGVGDLGDRLELVGVGRLGPAGAAGRRRPRPARLPSLARAPGPRSPAPTTPRRGAAGERSAGGVVVGEQQRPAVALGQLAALEQVERLVGQVEQAQQVRDGDPAAARRGGRPPRGSARAPRRERRTRAPPRPG